MHYPHFNFIKSVLAGLCFTTLASCTAVYFDATQPKDGINLAQVPDELTGVWKDDNETITISANCLSYLRYQTDSIGTSILIKETLLCLSDSVVLQKAAAYYVVNILDRENGWEIAIIERNKSGDLVWYIVHDPPFFGRENELRVQRVEERHVGYEPKDIPASVYKPFFKNPLDPNLEVPSIDAVYYTGQFRKKHIKEFLTSKNIEFIFKTDGTIDWKD